MCDPDATIWKVSITKSRPQVWTRCCHTVSTWTRNTFGTNSLHDCSRSVFPKQCKARCVAQNYFHSSETCVANAAVSKLTLPGVPPSLSPQLPSSPSSPFVNISKYAAKHSTWAQPGAPLDIAPFLYNSYLTVMCEHCAVRFLSQNKELFQLLILCTSPAIIPAHFHWINTVFVTGLVHDSTHDACVIIYSKLCSPIYCVESLVTVHACSECVVHFVNGIVH